MITVWPGQWLQFWLLPGKAHPDNRLISVIIIMYIQLIVE